MYFNPLTSPKRLLSAQRMVSIAWPVTCQTLQILFLDMHSYQYLSHGQRKASLVVLRFWRLSLHRALGSALFWALLLNDMLCARSDDKWVFCCRMRTLSYMSSGSSR